MKHFKYIVASILVMGIISCSDEGKLPEGFDVVWNQGNIFFVYLHKNLRGKKTDQKEACVTLCKMEGHRDCEVYMWSKKNIIPKGLPIRKAGSFVHSTFKLKNDKIKYKCPEC